MYREVSLPYQFIKIIAPLLSETVIRQNRFEAFQNKIHRSRVLLWTIVDMRTTMKVNRYINYLKNLKFVFLVFCLFVCLGFVLFYCVLLHILIVNNEVIYMYIYT